MSSPIRLLAVGGGAGSVEPRLSLSRSAGAVLYAGGKSERAKDPSLFLPGGNGFHQSGSKTRVLARKRGRDNWRKYPEFRVRSMVHGSGNAVLVAMSDRLRGDAHDEQRTQTTESAGSKPVEQMWGAEEAVSAQAVKARHQFGNFLEFQCALNEVMMRSIDLDRRHVLDEVAMWAEQVREELQEFKQCDGGVYIELSKPCPLCGR